MNWIIKTARRFRSINRLLKNDFRCFDGLTMIGKSPMFSAPAPFALSSSKGKRGVIQQPLKDVLNVSLTKSCNYSCTYCNQRHDISKPLYDMSEHKRIIVDNKIRSGDEWIVGLNEFPYMAEYNRLVFIGGEPSLHPDFFEIVAKVKGYKQKVIVTNLSFDVSKLIGFCQESNSEMVVQPSFHFEFADFDVFVEKMKLLDRHEILSRSIPVSLVDLPDRQEPREFKEKFKQQGYNAVLFEFEGYYKGRFDYSDKKGFGSLGKTDVVCCSSVTCVKPNGDIVYCPTDDYRREAVTYGNMCDRIYEPIDIKRPCGIYGMCHISSASWIKVISPTTGEIVWKGKNFPEEGARKDILNSFFVKAGKK